MNVATCGQGAGGKGGGVAHLRIQQVVALGAELEFRASRLLNLGIAVHRNVNIEQRASRQTVTVGEQGCTTGFCLQCLLFAPEPCSSALVRAMLLTQ